MESYRSWTYTFNDTPLFDLLNALPFIPLSTRKVILSYARTQPSPETSGLFESRYGQVLDSIVTFQFGGKVLKENLFGIFTRSIRSLLPDELDPLICGVIAGAVIAAPYFDYSEVESTKVATVQKEETAGIVSRFVNMNYSSILGDNNILSLNIPLYHECPPSPLLSRVIQTTMSNVRRTLDGARFYPRIGSKTIGREAQEQCATVMNQEFPDLVLPGLSSTPTTIADVEFVYHKTGILLQGRTEMRSAWKYNDLKPRCYYAQGPTHFHASKYIQEIVNHLVDAFPMCHRKSRFSLPRTTMLFGKTIRAAIYDYSSFTSSLTELSRFTQALGDFFADVSVNLLDTHYGWYTTSLGDVFHDYNSQCNTQNEVDLGIIYGYPLMEILYHQTGLLGVPGNITLSTLLHALHLAIISNSLQTCKCVGDDAFVLLGLDGDVQSKWLDFMKRINTLGDIAAEKFTYWDIREPTLNQDDVQHSGWNYLKRPLAVYHGEMHLGDLITIPSLELLLMLEDDYHKPSQSLKDPHRRLAGLLSQTFRMFSVIKNQEIELSEYGWWILGRFVDQINRVVRSTKDIRPAKNTPQVLGYKPRGHGLYHLGYMPRVYNPQDLKNLSLLDIFFFGTETVLMQVPKYFWDGSTPVIVSMMDWEFMSQSTKELAILEKFGYVEKHLETEERYLSRNLDEAFLNILLTKQFTPMYSYRVTSVPLPQWAV